MSKPIFVVNNVLERVWNCESRVISRPSLFLLSWLVAISFLMQSAERVFQLAGMAGLLSLGTKLTVVLLLVTLCEAVAVFVSNKTPKEKVKLKKYYLYTAVRAVNACGLVFLILWFISHFTMPGTGEMNAIAVVSLIGLLVCLLFAAYPLVLFFFWKDVTKLTLVKYIFLTLLWLGCWRYLFLGSKG